jgi:uncharacterized protein with GYD domain
VAQRRRLLAGGPGLWLEARYASEETSPREYERPKYLFQRTLTDTGLKGILSEGGTSRWKAVEALAKGLAGALESYYYAFGNPDLFVVMDLPDNAHASAASLIANAAGTTKIKTTGLITLEEVDQATGLAKKTAAAYRPPGQ